MWAIIQRVIIWWLVWRSGTGVGHINKVKLRRSRLVLGLVTNFGVSIIPIFSRPLLPTYPGHPSMGRCNECWRWFQPPLGKKRRVLRSSEPCRILAYLLYASLVGSRLTLARSKVKGAEPSRDGLHGLCANLLLFEISPINYSALVSYACKLSPLDCLRSFTLNSTAAFPVNKDVYA